MKHGVDAEKVSRAYGQLFGTIDFENRDDLTNEEFKRTGMKTNIGELQIGNSSFKVNLNDLRRLEELISGINEVVFKKYKLGLMR